tara:strand:- start:4802 stop:5170 length:369 start_codon:yes stop_codon:yes gene_type:complete
MSKKNRRSKIKYPALNPGYNLKSRADQLEIDYQDQLSESDKEWLNKFNEEYVNGVLDRKKKKNNLHNTKKLIKDCDDRNNARNRDVLTRAKARNEDYTLKETHGYTVEDEIIARIDKKKKST